MLAAAHVTRTFKTLNRTGNYCEVRYWWLGVLAAWRSGLILIVRWKRIFLAVSLVD